MCMYNCYEYVTWHDNHPIFKDRGAILSEPWKPLDWCFPLASGTRGSSNVAGHVPTNGCLLNGVTPKSSILVGFSIINQPFWGSPAYGNLHVSMVGRPFPLYINIVTNWWILMEVISYVHGYTPFLTPTVQVQPQDFTQPSQLDFLASHGKPSNGIFFMSPK